MKLQHNKTGAGEAELLAEIARTGFCRAVAVKSAAAQEVRILLKARAHLVASAARYGDRGPGTPGVLGAALSQGGGQAGRTGPHRLGGSSRLAGHDRAAVVLCRDAETRDRAAGRGGHGASQGGAGVPAHDERARCPRRSPRRPNSRSRLRRQACSRRRTKASGVLDRETGIRRPSLVDYDAIGIGQAIRRAIGRGAGKPRVRRDIHPPQRQRRRCGGRVVKACRRPQGRPLPVRLPDRNGGLPRLSDGP